MQTLSGLGGVGKSQLALAYAHAHKTAYDLVWWLPAEPEAALGAAMTALGRALGLPVDAIQDQQQIVQAVCTWLAGTAQRWLLIFDNADTIEPRQLRAYLPGGGRGHVLITSRSPHWQGVVGADRVLAVDLFTKDEAVAFLAERLRGAGGRFASGQEKAEAEAPAELLGRLPLALEHAAAYMETCRCSIAAYARLFSERRRALWARAQPPDAYHATITNTWEIAFRDARHTPGAADLLNLCCCLAPDNIPSP